LLNFRKILVRAAEFDYKKGMSSTNFRRSRIDGWTAKAKLAGSHFGGLTGESF